MADWEVVVLVIGGVVGGDRVDQSQAAGGISLSIDNHIETVRILRI